MESPNKVVLQSQLKSAGMKWNVDTAQYILSLKAKEKSCLWYSHVVPLVIKHWGRVCLFPSSKIPPQNIYTLTAQMFMQISWKVKFYENNSLERNYANYIYSPGFCQSNSFYSFILSSAVRFTPKSIQFCNLENSLMESLIISAASGIVSPPKSENLPCGKSSIT